MKNDIETILESFIKNEIAATDSRLAAIRSFVETLRGELLSYAQNVPVSQSEKESMAKVLKLFKSMISTYDDELKLLIVKREKMLDHLLSVRSVVTHLTPMRESELRIN